MHAQSVGGVTSGAAGVCDTLNSGFISLNAYVGNVLYWESSTDNVNWFQLGNPTSTQSYYHLKQTTSFRAIVKDGTFPEDTSTVSTVTVHVPHVAGTVAGGGTFCASTGDGTLVLSGYSGTVKFWQYSQNSGLNWIDEASTQPVLIHGDILQDRVYRAVVQSVPGCDADTSASAFIIINSLSAAGVINGGDTLCNGSPVVTLQVTGQNGNITGWFVSEEPGSGYSPLNTTANSVVSQEVTKTRFYKVSVKNGICPADTSAPAVVAVFDETSTSAGPDLTIVRHESVTISATGKGAVTWSPGRWLNDSTVLTPVASPINTSTFVLTVTDPAGCVGVDSMVITVIVPIPTAITPNGDGVNDEFVIHKIEEFPKNSLHVYNRWGLLVFEAAPYKNNWSGKTLEGTELPDETYYMIFDNGTGEKPVAGYILIKR